MPLMTGKQALAEMLIAEGVEFIFGNPGTSETPFLDGLQDYPQLKYMQALQEGTAVGMADGYARATGRPAFANIHIAGGLANGISGLYNAFRGGTPLVLTAGNSDTRMQMEEPTLSGDLVQMTAQYTKWSAEIKHASELPMAIRRAFKEAKTPPTGPVFLSFPWDTMDESADMDIIASAPGYHRIRPDREALERSSALLSNASDPVIIIGDRVAQSGASLELVEVAERLGARVFATSYSEVNFPTSHPLWGGILNTSSASARQAFAGSDVVLAVGANVFSSFLYVGEPFLGPRHQAGTPGQRVVGSGKNLPHRSGRSGRPKSRPGRVGDGFGPGHVRLCKGSGCDPLGHLGRVENPSLLRTESSEPGRSGTTVPCRWNE